MFNERCHDYYLHVWIIHRVGHCSYFPPSVVLTVFSAHYAQLAAVDTVDDHPQGVYARKRISKISACAALKQHGDEHSSEWIINYTETDVAHALLHKISKCGFKELFPCR